MPKETNLHINIPKIYRYQAIYNMLFGYFMANMRSWGEGYVRKNNQLIVDCFMQDFGITEDDIPRDTLVLKLYEMQMNFTEAI